MPKIYDDALKKLFRANAQDFVGLLQKDLRVEELLPTELDAEHIYADGLARCRDENDQPQLAHFEYKRENDKRMGERLLAYNVLASHLNDYLPVMTCVIYLKRAEDAPRSPFIRTLNNGKVTTIFYYASIDLGEITVEELLAKGLPGLLPLLPLTNGGNQHDVVDIMIEELTEAGKTDILWIGYVLAAKVFSNAKDLQWLKGRFAILNDFLWDSPIYQEIITDAEARGEARGAAQAEARGVETGKMQVLSQMSQELLKIVGDRFPTLKVLASKCVNGIDESGTLFQLGMKMSAAQTEQEAREILKAALEN